MQNHNEDLPLRNLHDVPPVPDGIYPAVMARVRRRDTVIRAAWTLAATLILALGIITYTMNNSLRSATVAAVETTQDADEINDELQIVYDFLNGSSIEDEVNQYALVDPSLF